jgi:hypothetical protein
MTPQKSVASSHEKALAPRQWQMATLYKAVVQSVLLYGSESSKGVVHFHGW